MSRSRFVTAIAAAALLGTSPVAACEVCSIFTFVDAKSPGRGWFAGIFQQFTDSGTLLEGGDEIENSLDQSLESWITQGYVGFRFGEKLGLQLTIPYIDRSYRRVAAAGEEHEHDEIHLGAMSSFALAHGEAPTVEEGSVSGLGDVALLLQYRGFERHDVGGSTLWTVFLGAELPTGDTDALAETHSHTGDEEAEHEHVVAGALVGLPVPHGEAPHSAIGGHDLALGSGSIDFLAGTRLFLNRGRWYGEGGAQIAVRQEGDFDYEFGDELTWSVQGGYFAIADHATNLGLGLQLSGEERAEDRQAGTLVSGTDLSAIYGGPALQLSHGRFYGDLELDLPLRQDSSGTMLVPDWRLRLALTASF